MERGGDLVLGRANRAGLDRGATFRDNALGRFLGTLLSGLLVQWGGIEGALVGSALMLAGWWLATLALPRQHTIAGSTAHG